MLSVFILLAGSAAISQAATSFQLLPLNGNTSILNKAPVTPAPANAPFVVYGWQGATLGGPGSAGQIFFPGSHLVTGQELTSVVFDLSSNKLGPQGSANDPTAGPQFDYAEWIVDPNNSQLDELVPYAAVPEPTTILAALAILAAVAYRERRRLASLLGRFSKLTPAVS